MTRPDSRCLGLLLLAASAALGSPRSAAAQAAPPAATTTQDPTQIAKEWMKTGSAAYERGDWEEARRAFEHAWLVKKHFAVAFDLADVEMKLGRYADAADHLKYEIANLPSDRDSDRSVAQAQLAECRTHLGHVRLAASVDGAAVTVDGAPSGTTPVADGLDLAPGTHSVLVSRAGYRSAQASLTIKAGESQDLKLELTPEAPPASAAPPPSAAASGDTGLHPSAAPSSPSDRPSASSGRLIVGITGGVLTAAGVAVGVIYTLKASDASNRAKSADAQIAAWVATQNMVPPDGGCTAPNHLTGPCNALSTAHSDENTDKTLRTVGFVSAGVFGVATLVTVLAWPKSSEAPGSARASLQLTPWASEHTRGLVLQGSF
jgi:tetratricopeptide (TPR) repeat protein